jgi:hypothetical protein
MKTGRGSPRSFSEQLPRWNLVDQRFCRLRGQHRTDGGLTYLIHSGKQEALWYTHVTEFEKSKRLEPDEEYSKQQRRQNHHCSPSQSQVPTLTQWGNRWDWLCDHLIHHIRDVLSESMKQIRRSHSRQQQVQLSCAFHPRAKLPMDARNVINAESVQLSIREESLIQDRTELSRRKSNRLCGFALTRHDRPKLISTILQKEYAPVSQHLTPNLRFFRRENRTEPLSTIDDPQLWPGHALRMN